MDISSILFSFVLWKSQFSKTSNNETLFPHKLSYLEYAPVFLFFICNYLPEVKRQTIFTDRKQTYDIGNTSLKVINLLSVLWWVVTFILNMVLVVFSTRKVRGQLLGLISFGKQKSQNDFFSLKRCVSLCKKDQSN